MRATKRNRLNAPGAFYVLEGQCIDCGAPPAQAPDLMTLGENGCYFHKQPSTPEETCRALTALQVSCIEIHRYDGSDAEISRRMAEMGIAHLSDAPVDGHPAVNRRRARFIAPGDQKALALLRAVAREIEAGFSRGLMRSAPAGGDDHAAFVWSFNGTDERMGEYALTRLARDQVEAASAPYRTATSEERWLLAMPAPPACVALWIHVALRGLGAIDTRWFSDEEWKDGSPGQLTPF